MAVNATQIERVLAEYPAGCQPQHIEPLESAGGFSGAEFWRLTTHLGPLCLRCWPPEHPLPERLQFIHDVLRHVERQGFRQLPVPLATRREHSFVRCDEHLWELTPWLAGTADYRRHPSPARLEAALQTVAHFHQAASSFPRTGPPSAPSPGIAERIDQVRGLLAGGCERIAANIQPDNWPELESRARRLLGLFTRAAPAVLLDLQSTVEIQVPLQPCPRDIWHDHVLFQGDVVTGLVDFGALRIESVAGDLARLLGSLAGDDSTTWQTGLAAYQAVRTLSDEELRLITVFDRSSVLLSGMNWLRWIYVDRRVFGDRAHILTRLDETLGRLERVGSVGPTGL